jgi:protein-S-isoprenylcysteine O-methyltransferase Ste14
LEIVIYLLTAAGLIAAGFVVFRFVVRRDYLERGGLTPLSAFIQLLLFFLHAMSAYVYMDISWRRIDTGSPLFIIAVVCVVAGLGLLLFNMTWLGVGVSFGAKAEGLRTTGLYRFTRNPQIVTGSLFYIGIALLWPSWGGLVWLGIGAVILHIMVLTEEDHLRKAFGAEYEAYCARTPRYLGFRKRKILS